jgi:hypothetical protein
MTLNPGTSSIYPNIVEEPFLAENVKASDEMQDDPARVKEGQERRHSKGVSWASQSDIVLEQDEPPEADLPSSSVPSDSDFADLGPSPSTSTADDHGSSPPSSYHDSTPIPRPRSPDMPTPMDPLRKNTNPSSPRVFPSVSKSSLDGRRLSSSSSQVGLWQKFKSNVRRPSTRDGFDEDEKASPRKRMSSLLGGKYVMTKTSNAAQAVGK